MEANDDELLTNFGATRCFIWGLELVRNGRCWAPLGTFVLILQLVLSWEPLTMLNPHFVAGEHGLFGAHESEDIRTI